MARKRVSDAFLSFPGGVTASTVPKTPRRGKLAPSKGLWGLATVDWGFRSRYGVTNGGSGIITGPQGSVWVGTGIDRAKPTKLGQGVSRASASLSMVSLGLK